MSRVAVDRFADLFGAAAQIEVGAVHLVVDDDTGRELLAALSEAYAEAPPVEVPCPRRPSCAEVCRWERSC